MKNKKITLLLILILLCVIAFCSVQIYAKYVTSAAGNTSMSIARWNISVNKRSIKNSSDISSSIVPVFPGTEHIASNIIAPTAEGYFDLNLDFSAADVSFKYEINLSVDKNSSVKDLVCTGYSIDNGEKVSFKESETPSITDTIYLKDNITNRNIRVYIVWDDTNSASMSNEDDTLAAISDKPALYHVDISFTQVID